MKTWIWIAALCGVTACGDNVGGLPEGSAEDACASTCNPIAQTGCLTAERCTYLHDGAGGFVVETSCGEPGPTPACVPDGSDLAVGAACVVTAGQPDGCAPTALCIAGTCRALCDTPTPTCAGTCAAVDGVDVCTP